MRTAAESDETPFFADDQFATDGHDASRTFYRVQLPLGISVGSIQRTRAARRVYDRHSYFNFSLRVTGLESIISTVG